MEQQKKTKRPVHYSPAKPFRLRRLLLQLLTVMAVVLAIFFGLSVFFKVQQVEVSGSSKYSADTILEASGIQLEDSLLFFGRAESAGRILTELPYIRTVRFSVVLPGKVKIIVEESPVVYAAEAQDGGLWLLDAEGKVVEQATMNQLSRYTRLLGFQLDHPEPGQQAVALEKKPGDTPVTVYESQRLEAALAVVQQLEANEILGKITTLDVTYLQKIKMQYADSYRIELGDSLRLDYKIAAVKQAIVQLGVGRTGVLDASFTTYPDKVVWLGEQEG